MANSPKLVRYPDRGRLLVAADLHGNLRDFLSIVARFEGMGDDAHLLFLGDLLHGPLLLPEQWPSSAAGAGQVPLRSSLARPGLTHNMAGFVDPGFCGSVITLELVNVLRFRALRLRPGLKIAQVAFFRGQPVPKHARYAVRGKYNWDVAAQPSKGVR